MTLSVNAYAQDAEVRFVCGDTWITLKPVGLNGPPLKTIAPVDEQFWTVAKDESERGFFGIQAGRSYFLATFAGKKALIHVAPGTYWKTAECVN